MLRSAFIIALLSVPSLAWAQSANNNPSQVITPLPQNVPAAPAQKTAPLSNKKFKDPYKAFDAGAYDQALQGFVDLQIEKPGDTDLMLSIGAAHYHMNNFEEAARSFESAATSGTKAVQSEAQYNLGNTYFKEGKLEESVKAYQRALELNPNDEDAKFNIEYVRDEIRRRHEEAKKRQQEQENQQQQKQQQQNENDQQDPNKQEEKDQQEDGQEGEDQQGKQDAPPQDTDKDGLSDEQEKAAKNPTDPNNPDSDGDGLSDGEEDKNGNGQVDKDETDPNKKDTNGNGVSDGEEAKKGQQQEANAKKGKQDMSKEDAERLLRNLGPERKPSKRGKKAKGRRAPGGKDW